MSAVSTLGLEENVQVTDFIFHNVIEYEYFVVNIVIHFHKQRIYMFEQNKIQSISDWKNSSFSFSKVIL